MNLSRENGLNLVCGTLYENNFFHRDFKIAKILCVLLKTTLTIRETGISKYLPYHKQLLYDRHLQPDLMNDENIFNFFMFPEYFTRPNVHYYIDENPHFYRTVLTVT